MIARTRAALAIAMVAWIVPGHSPAQNQGEIEFDRKIEMVGPNLGFAGNQTGTSTAVVDLCVIPATIKGSGKLTYKGAGGRGKVQLSDNASGKVNVSGAFACRPGASVSIKWEESWIGGHLAVPPIGEPKPFDTNWSGQETLRFALTGDPVTIETQPQVTYPSSPVDMTTASSVFSVQLCLQLCNPARVLGEFRDSTVYLQAYNDDALVSQGGTYKDYRARIWAAASAIRNTMPGQSGSGSGLKPGFFAGTYPMNCAIVANVSKERGKPDFRPLSDPAANLDCVLHDILVAHEMEHTAKCRALNGCQTDPADPLGPGINCQSTQEYGRLYYDNLENYQADELQAHCVGLNRIKWWIDQHLKCVPDPAMAAEAQALTLIFRGICGQRSF